MGEPDDTTTDSSDNGRRGIVGKVDLLDDLIKDKGTGTSVADVADEVIASTEKDTRVFPTVKEKK